MKLIIPIFLLVAVLAFSCKKESSLERTVFTPDPESPELPEYSEWGYNTFGAYYERQAFISTNSFVPLKIIETNGKTSLLLNGELTDQGYLADKNMVLEIKFPTIWANNYTDLVWLNNTTFNLNDTNIAVIITINNVATVASVFNGEFKFKRVQKLIVDGALAEIIISGTFEIQALVNNVPISISNGRFDFGVNNSNFYKY